MFFVFSEGGYGLIIGLICWILGASEVGIQARIKSESHVKIGDWWEADFQGFELRYIYIYIHTHNHTIYKTPQDICLLPCFALSHFWPSVYPNPKVFRVAHDTELGWHCELSTLCLQIVLKIRFAEFTELWSKTTEIVFFLILRFMCIHFCHCYLQAAQAIQSSCFISSAISGALLGSNGCSCIPFPTVNVFVGARDFGVPLVSKYQVYLKNPYTSWATELGSWTAKIPQFRGFVIIILYLSML